MTDQEIKEGSLEHASKPLIEVKANVLNVDFKGLEKFEGIATNLTEAIKRGIGRFYEPKGRIRDAKADRVVANERAQTIIDLTRKAAELADLRGKLGIESGTLADSQAARSIEFFLEENLRKQGNREKIAEATIAESNGLMPADDSNNRIDPDWLTKFWSLAENISNEELQLFLARLLTKETRAPGTASPLTLSVIGTMTAKVAQRFEHFCRLSIRNGGETFVIHPHVLAFQNIGPLFEYGVDYDDLSDLESFGLIRSTLAIMLNFPENISDADFEQVDYAGTQTTLALHGQLNLIFLTRAGHELRNLLHLSPIPEYTQVLKDRLKTGFVVDADISTDN